ncbi:DEHA2F26994p [Debaryomyces hansenii CBS767]|uniref:DEHA2F26994p n=1 Tax=Debaryomyces hansenii (strain ATCC 36239 / CBS 767 / BCRC 21394 / JCM 1990 / NBRC 0083 / IGC 2968) TaxID=284592 RepID=Q6BJV9_DEBHA|nr:DEHA2F26994p [Debaryomyces hansenii CBS767]CAG89940.1 DEHA2F26994p [Debaryomyces hansenii CBS767]|eukprot:XP_461512.1 DEHA2F26994p [Debaryomyces hansenii CBS767]
MPNKLGIRDESLKSWKAYNYTPSKAAAAIFIVLFGLATIFQVYQIVKTTASKHFTRSEKHVLWIMLPFVLGGIFEVIGYIGRLLSSNDVTVLGPYIIQSILLLVAPALYAATLYMSLGRLIQRMECQRYSIIPLKYLTKIFVVGDVVSFLMQAGGGGIMSSGDQSSMKTGERVIIGGLIVQIVFFGMFMVVEVIFHYRVLKHPNECAMFIRNIPSQFNNWNSILLTLLACSILIFVRSIFRLIEYIQGNDGYLISHEAFLYGFDAALMFLNMVIFISQDIGKYYVAFRTFKYGTTDSFHSSGSISTDKEALVGRYML